MMDYQGMRNALRRIVVSASGINAVTQLKTSGRTFDTRNKNLWIEEIMVGGEQIRMTNKREKSNAYLIQYNFCVPSGSGMDEIEAMASTVEENLPPGLSLEVAGSDCFVRKTKTSRSEGKQFSAVSLLVTLEFNLILR